MQSFTRLKIFENYIKTCLNKNLQQVWLDPQGIYCTSGSRLLCSHSSYLPDLALYDFFCSQGSKIPFMLKICPAQNFSSAIFLSHCLLLLPLFVGFLCLVFVLYCSICVLSSFAITSLGKRELVDASEKTYYKRNIITKIGYNTSCIFTSTHRIY